MTKSPMINASRRQHLDWIAILGITTAIISASAAAMAGFGHRLGWWHFSTGFSLLSGATIGALASILLSLGGMFRTRPRKGRRGFWHALLGLIVGLTVVSVPIYWWYMARSVPPIHDITTDTDNPPSFLALLPLRAEAPNPSHYGGPTVAAQQQKAYPDLKPLHWPLKPEQALDEAVAVARSLGWKVIAVTTNKDRKNLIEATDTTFWFGFIDDIVIRITPLDKGSRIDVRSVSRVGRSDVGANAHRIRTFLTALKKRAGGTPLNDSKAEISEK